jgi:hypothetical protein
MCVGLLKNKNWFVYNEKKDRRLRQDMQDTLNSVPLSCGFLLNLDSKLKYFGGKYTEHI